MASVLHGSARALAARYGLNVKTVCKGRKRTTTADAPMGPKTPKSTVLTPAEEAGVVALRDERNPCGHCGEPWSPS